MTDMEKLADELRIASELGHHYYDWKNVNSHAKERWMRVARYVNESFERKEHRK